MVLDTNHIKSMKEYLVDFGDEDSSFSLCNTEILAPAVILSSPSGLSLFDLHDLFYTQPWSDPRS
jgi:hypothetical protein